MSTDILLLAFQKFKLDLEKDVQQAQDRSAHVRAVQRVTTAELLLQQLEETLQLNDEVEQ